MVAESPAPEHEQSRFVPTSQDDLAPAGARQRIEANIAALETLRELQRAGRPATSEEKQVLARWGSWGAQGVWQVFDEDRLQYEGDRQRLHQLLSDKEYDAARRTTINAHYTDPAIVREVWTTLEHLGFEGGEVLEPGSGSGTFIGMAPESARMTGVELDPTTAAISQAIYPEATIRAQSFADTRYPSGHFDATVGNVPFADVTLHDPRYNAQGHSMHNHFIIKSLEMTRAGGMVAVLTSRYTMDSTNPAARRDMAAMADLVGAVRLPSGAHSRTAGTEAVTDLLILRKREEGTDPIGFVGWDRVVPVSLTSPAGHEEAMINAYFIEHPENVLGDMSLAVGMHGVLSLQVTSVDLEHHHADLRAALDRVEEDARRQGQHFTPRQEEQARPAAAAPALDGERDGFIVAHADGFFTQVANGVHEPLDVKKTQAAELRTLLGLRDQARLLISAEARELDDTPELLAARENLANNWRSYVDTYGPINRFALTHGTRTVTVKGSALDDLGEDVDTSALEAPVEGQTITVPTSSRRVPPVMHVLNRDPYVSLIRALEVFDAESQTAEPAGLLRERQIVPRQPVRGTDSPTDALTITLDRVGRVDLEMIGDLLGTDPERARLQLGDAIYETPPTEVSPEPRWVTRAEYLSGDVRTKLDEARAAAASDPQRWSTNVAALTAVIPEDLGPGDIAAKIGAVWIPARDHEDFMHQVLEDRYVKITNIGGANWDVENGDKWSVASRNVWGTERMPAPDMMGKLLRQEPLTVYDTFERDGKTTRVLNQDETQAAQEKGAALQQRFSEWVWEDPARSERLLDDYNRRFNATVLRDYSVEGEHMTFPGLVKNFAPRAHQRSAVARLLNEQSVGLFHQVGAGKTAEMVIGSMELKRLGMVNKPAIVVPNHMLEQFSREWLQLYPQANILAAGSKELAGEKRADFVARAATNDWDAVILTRGAFKSLSLSDERVAEYLERETQTMRHAIEAAKASNPGANGRTLKRVEKEVAAREEKLKKLLANPSPLTGVTFEETGIDYLMVDELHDFKNLSVASAIPGAGVSGSARAQDLDMKLDYLRQVHGDRVITGATATPIANSVTEMYVMQRYLDPQRLEQVGITDFDSWAATFGEVVTGFETNVVGDKVQLRSRFARFQNVPELLTMFHEFGDVKTSEDLNLPVPLLAPRDDGQRLPQLVTVPQSPELKQYISALSNRVDKLQGGGVDPRDDNMLKVSSDGRAAALDMRLVTAPEDYDLLTSAGKVEVAAGEIARVWAETADNRYLDAATGEQSAVPGALQIVFCDLSTPNPDKPWNAYEALRDELYSRGLPQGSVRFIHEANNDAEKARLFAAARSGRVSVLIGSTSRMGVGTNIQDRAVHILHMDAPWRPADVTQRDGRGVRQGNQNPEIRVTQLVTEGSFDTFMWQTLERKSRFIDQIMRGNVQGREIEDIGSDTLSFAEFKAIASGNPLLLEQAEAQEALTRFTRLHNAWRMNEASMTQTIARSTEAIERLHQQIPQVEAAVARTVSTAGDSFTMRWQGASYTSRADVAQAMERWVSSERWRDYDARDYGTVAQLAGHDITLRTEGITVYWGVDGLDITGVTEALRDATGPKLGLVTKLENLTQRTLSAELHKMESSLRDFERKLEQATASVGVPFKYTAELESARAKYQDVQDRITAQGQETLRQAAGAGDSEEAAAEAEKFRSIRGALQAVGVPGATRRGDAPLDPARGNTTRLPRHDRDFHR